VFSANCDGANEVNVKCPGTTGVYQCSVEGNYLKISGLNNSGVKGWKYTKTGGTGGGGGGGGGGGSDEPVFTIAETTCREDWICSSWYDCEEGLQTRQCFEGNGCGTLDLMPSMEQDCVVEEPEETSDTDEPKEVVKIKVERPAPVEQEGFGVIEYAIIHIPR